MSDVTPQPISGVPSDPSTPGNLPGNDPQYPVTPIDPYTPPPGGVPDMPTTPYPQDPVSGVPNPPTVPERIDETTPQPTENPFADPDQQAMFLAMANMLASMGLQSLFTYSGGRPGGWLWDTIVERDWTTEDEILIALEERPEYQERFKVMFDQRAQAARGEPVQIMTPAEIRAYELQAAQIMRAAGLPPEFYDNYKDFQTLMTRRISIQRLNERVNTSWDRVTTTAREVRDVMGEYYGVRGDGVLAAFFLDPDYTEANLDRMSRAAAVGGIARLQGFEVEREYAERVASMGASEQDAAKLAELGRLRPLFEESITESQDLQLGREGLEATYDLSANAARQIAVRRTERGAAFAGGGATREDQTGYTVGAAR